MLCSPQRSRPEIFPGTRGVDQRLSEGEAANTEAGKSTGRPTQAAEVPPARIQLRRLLQEATTVKHDADVIKDLLD